MEIADVLETYAYASFRDFRERRIDPSGFMRVKMDISLRKRALSPVRLVLEDSSKRSFMLLVVVSLPLGSII